MRRTGPDRSGPYACNYLNGPDPQPFLQSDRALFCLITGAKIVITLFIKEKKKKKADEQPRHTAEKWPVHSAIGSGATVPTPSCFSSFVNC